MKQEEVQKAIKAGKAEFVKPSEKPDKTNNQPIPAPDDMAKFIASLELLRRPKYHIDSVPDFTPKTFLEQIQFYDDGADQRIYFYVNNAWYYVTLT